MQNNQNNPEAAPKAKRPQEAPAQPRQKRPAPQGERPRRPVNQSPAKAEGAERPVRQSPKQPGAGARPPRREERRQPPRQQEKRQSAPHQRSGQPHPAAQRSIQLGGPHMRAAKKPTAQEQREVRKLRSTESASRQERTLKKNSLQNFISGIKGNEAKALSREEKSKERQRKRETQAAKRRKQAERDNTPAVIYTQPAAFNRNRLLIQLMTVTAVVAALVMALSVFFKVNTITVSGAEVYSPWSIREASGIQEGDNLLTFSRARASAQIRAALPYVDKVRIGIKLPETVIIYIEELDVAYAIKSSDGDWWLINSGGRVVEQVDGVTASNYTQVLGVTIANPVVNENAVATEIAPTETDASGEPIPLLVTGAQRLFSALQILKALEANDIVGEAASVDVSYIESVVLWYGTRYQVNLGDTNRMEYKIACMNDTILQLSDYQSGILDVSFTIWPNQVGYTPFS